MRVRSFLALLGCSSMMAALVSLPAAGQQVAPAVDVPSSDESTEVARTGPVFTLGLGVAAAPDYEGSDDYKAVPLWNLRIGNLYHPDTYVHVLGPTLKSNLLPSDHWRLGVSGRYIPERNDVEDDRVDRFHSVDASGMLGVMGGYDFIAGPQQDLGVMIDVKTDVSSDNGTLATLQGFYSSVLGPRSRFGVSVDTTWADDNYMSSYFGVSGSNAARSGLHRYDANEGLKDAGVTVSYSYAFAERWGVTALARYDRLLNDAADSPIVDDRGDANQFILGLLVNFTF
jgi:outer membrane protein